MGVGSAHRCPGIVLTIYAASLSIGSDLHKLWCAVLGLNQSRLAKRRRGLRLICYLRTFVVAWTLADLAGRTELGRDEMAVDDVPN
jgi:hypothetical protein